MCGSEVGLYAVVRGLIQRNGTDGSVFIRAVVSVALEASWRMYFCFDCDHRAVRMIAHLSWWCLVVNASAAVKIKGPCLVAKARTDMRQCLRSEVAKARSVMRFLGVICSVILS